MILSRGAWPVCFWRIFIRVFELFIDWQCGFEHSPFPLMIFVVEILTLCVNSACLAVADDCVLVCVFVHQNVIFVCVVYRVCRL